MQKSLESIMMKYFIISINNLRHALFNNISTALTAAFLVLCYISAALLSTVMKAGWFLESSPSMSLMDVLSEVDLGRYLKSSSRYSNIIFKAVHNYLYGRSITTCIDFVIKIILT